MTARRAKNTNRQGANFELRIMEYLRVRGYDVLRSSGSRGKIDVVAIGDPHILLIQAKLQPTAMPPAERVAVREVAARADAVPIFAYRLPGSVGFRELTGAGPKDWTLFEPITHPNIVCGTCGQRYFLHGVQCPQPGCKECPCGTFTFPEKESKA